MATISKRGNRWFAQIRRKGFAARYKTFETKHEARAWSRNEEALIDRGIRSSSDRKDKRLTVREMINRYKNECSICKRGADSEIQRLTKMQREPMCDLAVTQLSPSAIAEYRDKRLTEVKPATVRREIGILRHALEKARKEWGLNFIQNPVDQIDLPSLNNARNRRLNEGELDRIMAAFGTVRNPFIKPIVLFAIETAMRRSEILNLAWHDIDYNNKTAFISHSKTGVSRTIPLTDGALDILSALDDEREKVFPTTARAVQQCWTRIRNRAGLSDFRFHDLRHEAISRFCELGLSIPEVALISGHRDPRMLFRYAHLRPSQLAKKLTGRSWHRESED